MAKPKPTSVERRFDVKELFFSTTNERGIVLTGNDVFVRVSAYKLEQLVGAPHSIIRHPDMPRIVFKLLWDTIQSGKMIAAYVKNMAADGGFYWVLAVVFPVGNEYLSIRLKPTTALKDAAEAVYKLTLEEEEKNGMEASAAVLFKCLNDAGFKTYEDFMKAALFSEITSRDQAMNLMSSQIVFSGGNEEVAGAGAFETVMERLNKLSDTNSSRFRSVFQKISDFESSSDIFQKQVEYLLKEFSQFQLLSLNMRVFAGKIGEAGASIGVVAENFQSLVHTIEKYLQDFSKSVDSLYLKMRDLTIVIAALKTQMDMVDFFIKESLLKVTKKECTAEEAFSVLGKSSDMFLSLSDKMMISAIQEGDALYSEVQDFLQANLEIRKFVNGIEIIHQIGAIESARLNEGKEDFAHSIMAMGQLSEVLRESTQKISQATKVLSASCKVINDNLKGSSRAMHEVIDEVMSVQGH